MRQWVVFEAGSRAGLSARLFFDDYCKRISSEDTLLLVDDDECVVNALNETKTDRVCAEGNLLVGLRRKDAVVFPADELTRQQSLDVDRCHISRRWFNDVVPAYYNKNLINRALAQVGICVPATFCIDNVLIKPNTMSAGSRGIRTFENVCVQQRLYISQEFVVDATVDESRTILGIIARETKLRAGYDKLIRFVESDHPVVEFARQIIECSPNQMFQGVCHLQICCTNESSSQFYYIEGSKRISGTSMVNLLADYNPFVLLHTKEQTECIPFDTKWHTYEDLLVRVNKKVYE